MRNASADGAPVLPWLLIRQDDHGNRYRVGSYATRAEARLIADRLGKHHGAAAPGEGAHRAGSGDPDGYLVEWRDGGSGARG